MIEQFKSGIEFYYGSLGPAVLIKVCSCSIEPGNFFYHGPMEPPVVPGPSILILRVPFDGDVIQGVGTVVGLGIGSGIIADLIIKYG